MNQEAYNRQIYILGQIYELQQKLKEEQFKAQYEPVRVKSNKK